MHAPTPSRAAYLLAGGKSSRMGENKAFIDFKGQTLLARVLAALSNAVGKVTIVGDPEIYANYAPVICDVYAGCGPLAGIHAALTHSSAELNLMLAVDMPFVSPELLRYLLSEAEDGDVIVTVPQTRRGLQPLCAVYRREFAAIAERAIRAGDYKIDAAFAGLEIHVVPELELVTAGFSERNFFNVNTPDDRRAAEL